MQERRPQALRPSLLRATVQRAARATRCGHAGLARPILDASRGSEKLPPGLTGRMAAGARCQRRLPVMMSLPRFALIATLVVLSGPAMAQSGPTAQEQAACRPDAMKLCASFVGKPPEMNACLRSNKDKLSEACRKVVESRGG